MSGNDWRAHLDSATRSASLARSAAGPCPYGLTVVWHPDVERVGERASLPGLLSGRAENVSRLVPGFARLGGEPRPLADPYLSRQPFALAALRSGGVRVDPGETPMVVTADGQVLREPHAWAPEALESGVVLGLAGRIVLALHRLETLPPLGEDLGLVGESASVERLRREIHQVADLSCPVLVRGASGTGKELVARGVHDTGPRRTGPWVALNLAAIPESLVSAELFGVARGAYTGAHESRRGAFREAHGGTLFLDEIGAARPEVQTALLRVLEEGAVRPVGASAVKKVDVRVIAATDADLEEAMARGTFNAPLFHRLSPYVIEMPRLAERRDDIGRLFLHFLREALAEVGESWRLEGEAAPVRADLVHRLTLLDWPGNVRELRNVVWELVVANRGVGNRGMDKALGQTQPELTLTPKLERRLATSPPGPATAPEASPQAARRRAPSEFSKAEIRAALLDNQWEPKAGAAALGLKRGTLYGLMRNHGILPAADLSREEIERCQEECGALDLKQLARRLEVSEPGLRRRMKELAMHGR